MEQQKQKENAGLQQQKTVKAGGEQKPKGYSAELVRQVQLNQLGYNAGKADGIYGPGTRKAIEAFQAGQGIPVDGQPSQKLLSQLKQPGGAAAAAVQQPAAQKQQAADLSGLPEPSRKALTLAGLHFRPEVLNQESILKDIVLTVYPDMQPVVSNEFKWVWLFCILEIIFVIVISFHFFSLKNYLIILNFLRLSCDLEAVVAGTMPFSYKS